MDLEDRNIIWTRSAEDWEADLNIFAGHYKQVLHLPAIKTSTITQIQIPEIQPGLTSHLFFTSPKSVEYALKQPSIRLMLQQARSIWSIGSKTSEKLFSESKQYPELRSQDIKLKEGIWTTVKSMTEAAIDEIKKTGEKSIIISPGPRVRAFDVQTLLEQTGVHYAPIDLYQTQAGIRASNGKPLLQSDLAQLKQNLHGVICFASPSAVTGFVKYLEPEQNGLTHQLIAASIGPTTHEVAKEYFIQSQQAENSSSEALFRLALNLFNNKA